MAVNQAFADAVLEELEREPAATVFFHDYHLYVAPALVRAQRPEASLAHFTHIPWVDAEAWSVLPAPIVTAIHSGLLANDVVGFHTERWRNAFLSACSSLGLDTGGALVTAHPISIDPDEFTGLAQSDAVLARERELVASRPETMILRVDRTDPSKNVVRGLEAFGLLLERRPDLRGRVGMLALLDPSRQTIPEYVEELQRIQAAAASLEERFPGALETTRRGRLPPVDRGVQAVRRSARERGHGRAEPRREGGAARQHPRRGCCLVCQRRCARGAGRVGDLDRSVRCRGSGLGARGGDLASAGTSAARGWRRSASTCAATTWKRGSRPSWPTSTARVRCGGHHERPLARRRVRLCAHGRRRREADVAASCRSARVGANGA